MSQELRRKLKYYIPFVTAPVSLVSSSYLIYTILKKGKREWMKQPKLQLLIGLSILDICGSFAYSFSTVLAPSWLYWKYPTYGNTQTCSAQGFLVQISLGVPMYNAMICIYFLLTVKFQMDRRKIEKWVLPSMHISVFVFAFGTAITALSLKLYNYGGVLGCYINDPASWSCYCDYGDGTKRGMTYTYGDLVKNKNKKWGCYGEPTCEFDWEADCSLAKDFETAERCIDCEICDRSVGQSDIYETLFMKVPVTIFVVFVMISMIVLYCTVRKTEMRSRQWSFDGSSRDFLNVSSSTSQQQQQQIASTNASSSSLNINSNKKSRVTLSQRTMETGLLYSGVLVLTYLPTGIDQLMPTKSFIHRLLQILIVILLPLQGFFNLLIHTSPEWLPIVEKWRIWQCFSLAYKKMGRCIIICLSSCRSNLRHGGSDGLEITEDTHCYDEEMPSIRGGTLQAIKERESDEEVVVEIQYSSDRTEATAEDAHEAGVIIEEESTDRTVMTTEEFDHGVADGIQQESSDRMGATEDHETRGNQEITGMTEDV